MIQRKQTLYLLAAFVLTIVCMFTQSVIVLLPCLLLSATLTLACIFLYKRRKLQAFMCLIDIMLLLIWYVLLAALPQMGDYEIELDWSDALPAVSIILLFLARLGILADEKLVRSLDRIR
jgi:hypothetical protein